MGDTGYSKSDQIQFITRTSFKSKFCDQLKNPCLDIKPQRTRGWIDASNNITTYHKNNLQHQYVVDTLHTNQIVLPKESNINLQADKEFIFRVGRGISNSGMINKKIIEEKEYEQQKDVYDAIHKEPQNINKPEIQLKSNVVPNEVPNLTTPDINVSTNIQTNQPIGGREIDNMNIQTSPTYSDSGYYSENGSTIDHKFEDLTLNEQENIYIGYIDLIRGYKVDYNILSENEQKRFLTELDKDKKNNGEHIKAYLENIRVYIANRQEREKNKAQTQKYVPPNKRS